MEKLLFGFLLFSILGVGCKKDTEEAPIVNYIRFKANGISFSCTGGFSAFAHYNGEKEQLLSIRGDAPPIGNLPSFDIEIYLIAPGNLDKLDPGVYHLVPDYQHSIRVNFGGWVSFAGSSFTGHFGSGKITITETTNKYVKGTFDFISGNGSDVVFTDGEFQLIKTRL